MMPNKKIYHQILTASQSALEYLDLVYTNDKHLDIERIKIKDGFVYKKNSKNLNSQKELERINSLVIPPAWEDVKISSFHNGHIQAIGRDDKLRKQYRYHEKWIRVRNQTKFYKMYDFGKVLPKIRKQVEKDLRQKKLTKTKVVALIVKLLEDTHIRIGNQQYAKRNKTYGLSTLRTKHVDVYKGMLKFHFIGKKGKEHEVTLKNKKLIKLVNQCEEIPGWELFKYFDEDGIKHSISSSMVNEYLHKISGAFFTAKDFRTWAASLICFETLMHYGLDFDEKEKDKNILDAIDAASKALGNTRSVARKYYVHPFIVSSYKDNTIEKAFKKAQKPVSKSHVTSSEQAMLYQIKNFDITI